MADDSLKTVSPATYAGLFLVTLSVLMYEILLTRIFSVTMWYHLAFVAVSIAMFGMTAGALLVYLYPNYFTAARARQQMASSAFWFTVSMVLSFLTYLCIPMVKGELSLVSLYVLALTYLVIAVPFVFGGICVCLALTKFPSRISGLYAADLAGAASGCILVIYALRFTDGPTAVFVIACLAGVGAVCFAAAGGGRRLTRAAAAVCLALLIFTVVQTVLVHRQNPLVKLVWIRGGQECASLYEKWNSFSRVRVWGDPDRRDKPFGWGLSSTLPPARTVKQLHLNIDAAAYTPITAYDGSTAELDFLRYDITNMVHYIQRDAKVLVIGSGGGRDILSAIEFGQRSIEAVEINNNIIETVNRRFGDFSGHLDRDPRVRFVNDEARSYIARHKGGFDIIQSSLIDTWAATAAGAFVLAENSLYTVEAWKLFMDQLAPRGVLSFSRWYLPDKPGELYRLVSLATATLKQQGVEELRNHLIVITVTGLANADSIPLGVGTLLMSKTPFHQSDLDTLIQVADRMKFQVLLGPESSSDPVLASLCGPDRDRTIRDFPLNISAPTDDKPFFFFMLRFKDMFNRDRWKQAVLKSNLMAVVILGSLLIVMFGLTFLCILVPLMLTADRSILAGSRTLFMFFAAIGLGFMFVEISQLQRLSVFLGHPTYSLSVVLFALLLSGGLGSATTRSAGGRGLIRQGRIRLLLLLAALIMFGILTPAAIDRFQGSGTPIRILVAVGLLFPLGGFMGMAFPLGLKMASNRPAPLTPWLWGINGATSVCASVLAIVIALAAGISASFWTGVFCYAVALLAFIRAGRVAAAG